MAIAFPYTLKDGEIADAAQVMANLEALRAALEAGGYGASSVISKYIATEEERKEEGGVKVTEYHTMPTPDEVTIVLPSESLIAIAYQATWGSSISEAGSAAIFLGANQLKRSNQLTRSAQEAIGTGGTVAKVSLFTTQYGLASSAGEGGPYIGDATTGQIVGGYTTAQQGGVCYVFAAAETYKISVQFKASSGTVKAKERKLWVWLA